MASKFDNEMDFLLRQVARQNDAMLVNEEHTHLDADDLAAFAENAVPQSARSLFISHLADCDSCRKTLSNLILLNETAQEEETATLSEPEKIVVAVKSSWLDSFKNLFAFPTLGYAMAGLAVLLIGSYAFVALRRTQENTSATIAQVEPEQTAAQAKKRPAAPQPIESKDENEVTNVPEPSPTTDNSNLAIADSSPSPNETPADLPPSVRITRGENSGNRNVAPPETAVARNNSANLNSAANVAASPAQPTSPALNSIRPPASSDSQIAQANVSKPANRVNEELLAQSNNRSSDDKDKSVRAENGSEITEAAPSSAMRKRANGATAGVGAEKKPAVETRTIGSRTFQKLGGVWKDAAYNSQNLTNISRGSDEYKKLDASLRSIAESLSGEIIVVWQSKAYRIR